MPSLTLKTPSLPAAHFLLALLVVAVWGTNFVIIKFALTSLPPLMFAALRFVFAFLPAAFFIRRPNVPWLHLAGYGLLIGAGQFGLLYIAMGRSISPGLASLVIQTQVFFTIGLSMWSMGERVRPFQWIALVLSTTGLGIIILHGGGDATPFGLALILLAALSWAFGNIIAKASGPVNMLGYVVWASLFSFPPLLVLSVLFEGLPAIAAGFANSGWMVWAAVLYQSAANTLFGYASWGWLLARHPAATITPVALLIPVFGMSASALMLGEALPGWKLAAAALVLSGLAFNLLWPKFSGRFSNPVRQAG